MSDISDLDRYVSIALIYVCKYARLEEMVMFLIGMLNEVRIFELRKKYSNSNSFLTLRSSTSKYRLV